MAGVYISYPFCQQKCSFCNFASNVAPWQTREQYHKALTAEIGSHVWQWLPETVYFGGGTPSLMPPSLFTQIMAEIPPERLSEITLECAPGTLTKEAVRSWRQRGVNRISLGVQSFVANELRTTSRRHTADTVLQDVQLLRDQGIDNINLDLIAGLPEQTARSWEGSLDWIERLQPPHVSLYIFEQDEDSRLGKELLLGGVRYGASRMPSEDLVADLYEGAVARLAQLGIERYEISNFSRVGFESLHNLKYWKLVPYIGFGLDAHSFDGVRRWNNPDSLAHYLSSPPGRMESVTIDPSEEHFYVGLRLMQGIEPTEAEWTRFAQPIARWIEAGLLEHDGSRLRLSSAGVLLSNEIFQEFV
ncbi:MAG: radical SAM family heme chaperone HemW [Acidobacteriaceae bacterium]|nr:radical SAM family heme chaperone HemW [Acidobacteriaceae bacterium]